MKLNECDVQALSSEKNLNIEYWLALIHAPRLSPINLNRLLNYFGTPRNLFEADSWEWRNLTNELRGYLRNPDWLAVEKDMQWWAANPEHHLLTLHHANYPRLLREIYDPPLLLFVQGDCTILSNQQLAMVGTRHSSDEGKETARIFAEVLSNQGFTITSGMASGIESASHWGALAGTGKTIAVGGWGLATKSPIQYNALTHKMAESPNQYNALAHKIAETGALISEFPPDTPARREHFLRRSRIVSGLSLGTLVIDVPKYSNALDTVRFALEQGREVFAIPGSIHNPLVKGCNQLIKDGAKLVENVNDILEELQIYIKK